MKRLIPILLAVFAFAACEKDPDFDKLADQYLVYTSEANTAAFNTVSTYYLADTILVASTTTTAQALTGTGAQDYLNAIAAQMNARGYKMSTDKSTADLAISVTYVQSTYYFSNYGYRNWNSLGNWWGNWWGNYWGWGGGFYYPYALTYSMTTNSFIIDMAHQTSASTTTGSTTKVPIWWTGYMVAPAYATSINYTLAIQGVQQAFNQSPYIKK